MNRVEPNRNVYIGHRYVPLLVGEWDKSIQYEGLSIVTFKGASYTSKKMTPPGIDIENEEYWVLTGNYNAQIEYYRQETERVSDELETKSDQTYVDTELDKKSDKTYVDTELGKKSDQTYVDTELDKKSDKTYVDTELNKKSDKTYVDTELDKVDTELNKKSDKTYVDTELNKKSDKTYVDTELGKKVDKGEIILNLNDYNISGDGVTDDTENLNTFFENVSKATVYIPNKVYAIKSSINIKSNTNVIAETGATLKVIPETNQTGDRVEAIKIVGQENIFVENLEITTNENIVASQIIQVTDSDNIHFNNLKADGNSIFNETTGSWSEGIGDGIKFDYCNNISVINSTLKNFRSTHGVATKNCDNVLIDNNIINMTNRAGISINAGTTNAIYRNNKLSKNQMGFISDGAIDMYGYLPLCKNITIENNTIKDVGYDTINRTSSLIRLKDFEGVKVLNNTLISDDFLHSSIYVQTRDEQGGRNKDLLISGNDVYMNGGADYYIRIVNPANVYKDENVTINKNNFYGSGDATFEFRSGIKNLIFSDNMIKETDDIVGDLIVFFWDRDLHENIIISDNVFETDKRILFGGNFNGVTYANNISGKIDGKAEASVRVTMGDNTGVMIIGNIHRKTSEYSAQSFRGVTIGIDDLLNENNITLEH